MPLPFIRTDAASSDPAVTGMVRSKTALLKPLLPMVCSRSAFFPENPGRTMEISHYSAPLLRMHCQSLASSIRQRLFFTGTVSSNEWLPSRFSPAAATEIPAANQNAAQKYFFIFPGPFLKNAGSRKRRFLHSLQNLGIP